MGFGELRGLCYFVTVTVIVTDLDRVPEVPVRMTVKVPVVPP